MRKNILNRLTGISKYLNNASYGDNKPNGKGTIIVPDPIKPYQSANKNYVDTQIANASTQLYRHHFSVEIYVSETTSQRYEITFISNDSEPYVGFDIGSLLIEICYRGFGGTIYVAGGDYDNENGAYISFNDCASVFLNYDPGVGDAIYCRTDEGNIVHISEMFIDLISIDITNYAPILL